MHKTSQLRSVDNNGAEGMGPRNSSKLFWDTEEEERNKDTTMGPLFKTRAWLFPEHELRPNWAGLARLHLNTSRHSTTNPIGPHSSIPSFKHFTVVQWQMDVLDKWGGWWTIPSSTRDFKPNKPTDQNYFIQKKYPNERAKNRSAPQKSCASINSNQ